MITTELTIADEEQRLRALDTTQSFIVQAPAGSGKTELLTQRFLILLGRVRQPEEILAITFTKKAAAEMRARIIKTLHQAANHPEPEAPHAKKTWRLARTALQQNEKLQWELLTNPNRLRIQTIDSFNASLTKYLPMLSNFGAPPDIAEDAEPLYRAAVQEFLSHLEENVAWADAIAVLLQHRDNDLPKVEELLITMLGKRDQWLPYVLQEFAADELRAVLESHLATVVNAGLENLQTVFSDLAMLDELLELTRYAAGNLKYAGSSSSQLLHCLDILTLPASVPADLPKWQGFLTLLLTLDLTWRKRLDKNLGFPAESSGETKADKQIFKIMKQRAQDLIEHLSENVRLHQALIELHHLPAAQYDENQWQVLSAFFLVLRMIVAQLRLVFRQHGKIDYIENAQAALFALGNEESPTDLAFALDYQLQHILIDEFQDTSNTQYRLLEKLISGWQPGDGRTLFVVGDPMQSIYRFREAEVGLFIRARKLGIAHLPLEPLTLAVNFRSTPHVVEWINQHFSKIFTPYEDIATGAVIYAPSVANTANADHQSQVLTHVVNSHDQQEQASQIVELIQTIRRKNPQEKIAILVRARPHLKQIIPALKMAGLDYRAIKIDALNSRPYIQDLMALSRALINPADKVAWLATLRAPWCGLKLADLMAFSSAQESVLSVLQNAERLALFSEDGQVRLRRVAPILISKARARKRLNLRLWVESTWLALGGPACLDHSSELADVTTYFELLATMDSGGELPAHTLLEDRVKKLFAAPNTQADTTLQIMTIHNAKGLEFDTVILPYLEKKPPNDKKQLLLWLEKPTQNATNSLILAPLNATDAKSDSIYDYVSNQLLTKADHEIGRLLYVAATRARKNLHLFLTPKSAPPVEGVYQKPKLHSLLEKLQPAMSMSFNPEHAVSENAEVNNLERAPRTIQRLTSHWHNPIVELGMPVARDHQNLPGMRIIKDHAKLAGTLVHQILQQISKSGLSWWQAQPVTTQKKYITQHLQQLGIRPDESEAATATVSKALINTLQDERGRWLLHAHTEAKSELALTAVINSVAERLVLDRTFVDENNIRWIIDYKTTDFSGENLQDFLSQEREKYADKMRHYAGAMRALDERPIHLGLYFPLIPAWFEWQI